MHAYCLGTAITKFMVHFYRNDSTDLRAMSYEGIEIKACRFTRGSVKDRIHINKANGQTSIDMFNIMALQLMPRHFQNDIESHETTILTGIDACLKHLGIRHLITDKDIRDFMFDYNFIDTVHKLDL